jgi:hypothetical protein
MKYEDFRNKPYAYAFARTEHNVTQITVVIRNVVKGSFDYTYDAELVARCYVGPEFFTPYGARLTFDGHHSELREVNAVVKAMSKIERRLLKCENAFGQADSFEEFARRCLMGAGIEHVFVEDRHGRGASDLANGIFGLPCCNPNDGLNLKGSLKLLVHDTVRKYGKKVEA